VGGIVGHELTHGFDDEGRQFGANGNLSDWWTPEDAKKFEEKADCEVKEYGSFVAVDDVKVNGKLTLGENTADNGGLRLAYIAFLADAKRKSIDLTAKQDGYTPLQQFFLGHGQTWCGSTRPEQLRLQVQTDPHSPRQFRVNGVVQNMTEFGQAFGCKNWPAHDAGQRLPCLVRCGEGQTLWPDHALRAKRTHKCSNYRYLDCRIPAIRVWPLLSARGPSGVAFTGRSSRLEVVLRSLGRGPLDERNRRFPDWRQGRLS